MNEKKIDGEAAANTIIGSGASSNLPLMEILRDRFNFDYKNPPFRLSYDVYLQMLEYVRQAIYPNLDEEEGYETLGRTIPEGHFQGLVGKVNKIAAKLMSPEQGTELYMRVTKAALPFAHYEVEEVRKGYIRFRQSNVPGPPAIERGILKASLEAGRAKNIKVTSKVVKPEEVIFEVTWD
jgi:uncharacterized protein (TIGR02265 family)